MSAECWDSFIDHWLDPKTEEMSSRNVSNRMGGSTNGKAPSTHTDGFKSHYVHAMEMMLEGVMPKHIDMYSLLHKLKNKGHAPCNPKVAAIIAEYNKRKDEEDALASQQSSHVTMDDNERFFQVIGPPKKGRWTGVRTETNVTPIGGIPKYAMATPVPPIQTASEDRIVERILKLVNPSIDKKIQAGINEKIGNMEPGGEYVVEQLSDDETDFEGNEHAMDEGVGDDEESIIGVDNNQFVSNLLYENRM